MKPRSRPKPRCAVLRAALTGAAIVALAHPATSPACPGDLDRSFGRSGEVLTPLKSGYLLARQPGGKLLVRAGVSKLVRYEPDGSRDRGFGTGGIVQGNACLGHAVLTQPDGSFVGDGYYGFRLSRCRPDGSLDPSFGKGGRAEVSFGEESQSVLDLTRQRDGRLVAVGRYDDPDPPGDGYSRPGDDSSDVLALARYLPDGSPDQSFGDDGRVVTSLGGLGEVLYADNVVQPDGKIVVSVAFGPHEEAVVVALLRYNADGSLDRGFGAGGRVPIRGDVIDLTALALDRRGRIVLAASLYAGSLIARYRPDGSPDRSFGGDGRVLAERSGGPGSALEVYSLVIAARDRIIVGGTLTFPDRSTRNDFAVARYLPDGSPDASFGRNGEATSFRGHGGSGAVYDLVLEPGGRLIAAGKVTPSKSSSRRKPRVALAAFQTRGR